MEIATGLSASLEDYLEAIYHITARKKAARAKDICARLGVNNSSVTGALHNLADLQLVNYAPYDIVTLTASGEIAARKVVSRHRQLYDFLIKVLGIDPQTAEDNACKIEHVVSESILRRLALLKRFVLQGGEAQWLSQFNDFCADQTKTTT